MSSEDDTNVTPLLPDGSAEELTEKATQMIEKLALSAEKSSKISIEDSNAYYDSMAQILDEIINAVKDRTHAYQFLKAKGLNRIVSVNLGINHPEVSFKLLTLLKTLFEVAPVTTKALIPKSITTRLLDIFADNPNLALKAHALDILYKWLPNNPEIQIQVMKLRGLEPFYVQINKLDISVIQTLLELFNTVLKEHIAARSDKAEVTKLDHERRVMYQKIGLLERMKTSNVCNGLVNIFQIVWAYNNNGNLVKIVLELIENTKPFCGDKLKGRGKALALFENVLKFVKSEDQKAYFDDIGLDVVKFESVLEDYVDKVKINKDEF